MFLTKKMIWIALFIIAGVLFFLLYRNNDDRLSLFPLDHYSQTISDWIKPTDENYDTPLMTSQLQKKRFAVFYEHVFGLYSPWNKKYVMRILQLSAPDDLGTIEKEVISTFNNQKKSKNQIGYGENFRPHTLQWMEAIVQNINLIQFSQLKYNEMNFGIAVRNLYARALPTDDVHFYNYRIAGQGYPFDNLQVSALWVGTPLYILGETRDHAWMMVMTPDFIAWVKSEGVARANQKFIQTWTQAAKKQLMAITKTQTPILNQQKVFRFQAYIGSVFPAINRSTIMIPSVNHQQQAVIDYVSVPVDAAVIMPFAITPHHMVNIMSTLIGRPYGWGNAYFYNDCSSELKNLFTPFGIWLPRHSSDQVTIGKWVDKTQQSPEQRLSYLMENGRRFMTIVYIGNHVFLYVGNYSNPNDKHHSLMAMTYQNVWGLHPQKDNSRAVIGQSVLFPLLLKFPERSDMLSQAARKFFQVAYLDEPYDYLNLIQQIDLKALMS